ncbi:MAG: RNA-binding protein [Thermoprotei archaeon]|nr:MAG: RNA-binding protein [Thermoprotei archaeon]RLF01081.1 MAG: RNA-binding protein [Thermoprotei archaeon]
MTKYPPRRTRPCWSIAIPSSLISEAQSLREKTAKIGLIGRAAAIFRVDKIYVYREGEKSLQNQDLIIKILEYMECPQYLRKYLILRNKSLRYVGILPPLRTPHHPLKSERIMVRGREYREGIIIKWDSKRGKAIVDIGLDYPLVCEFNSSHVMKRVTVDVSAKKIIKREEVPIYWGYKVVRADSLLDAIKKSKAGLVIGTSRHGVFITTIISELKQKLNKALDLLVLFGGPKRGIYEIFREEGADPDRVCDYIVNFAPFQGTKTIRTEEAVLIVLSILNII